MARRNPGQYNWGALEFDETILPAVPLRCTSPRQGKIAFAVLHHMTVLGRGDGGANDACYNIWQSREASAHYGVDGKYVRQFVWDSDAAWATANWNGNHQGISIEHANSATGDASGWPIADETWKTGARLTAYLHKAYGLGRPWTDGGNAGTVRVHRSFFATGCPGAYMMAILDQYVAEAARIYDALVSGVNPASSDTFTPIVPEEDIVATLQELEALLDQKLAGLALEGKDKVRTAGPLYPLAADVAFIRDTLSPGVDKVRHAGAIYGLLHQLATAQSGGAVDPNAIAKSIVEQFGKEIAPQIADQLQIVSK